MSRGTAQQWRATQRHIQTDKEATGSRTEMCSDGQLSDRKVYGYITRQKNTAMGNCLLRTVQLRTMLIKKHTYEHFSWIPEISMYNQEKEKNHGTVVSKEPWHIFWGLSPRNLQGLTKKSQERSRLDTNQGILRISVSRHRKRFHGNIRALHRKLFDQNRTPKVFPSEVGRNLSPPEIYLNDWSSVCFIKVENANALPYQVSS